MASNKRVCVIMICIKISASFRTIKMLQGHGQKSILINRDMSAQLNYLAEENIM